MGGESERTCRCEGTGEMADNDGGGVDIKVVAFIYAVTSGDFPEKLTLPL